MDGTKPLPADAISRGLRPYELEHLQQNVFNTENLQREIANELSGLRRYDSGVVSDALKRDYQANPIKPPRYYDALKRDLAA